MIPPMAKTSASIWSAPAYGSDVARDMKSRGAIMSAEKVSAFVAALPCGGRYEYILTSQK
jgi:hypothetical protein